MIPSRVSWTALLCFVQLSFAGGMMFQRTDITRATLEVEILNLDLQTGFIEYQLTNAATEPLTAIAFNIVVLYRDGTRFEDPTMFECIYSAHFPKPAQVPALHPGKGAVWPGQAVYFRDKITEKDGTQVVTAFIEPQAAVMMDRRAVGNKDILARIADARRGFYEALTTWAPVFEQTLTSVQIGEDPVFAIDALLKRVEKTEGHRGALTRPQLNHAKSHERLLRRDASSILQATKENAETGIGRLSRKVERYWAQLTAARNSWNLIELEEAEQ